MACRHLKISRESLDYSYHKIDLFGSRGNYFSSNMARNNKEALSERLCDNISQRSCLKNGFHGDYIQTHTEACPL